MSNGPGLMSLLAFAYYLRNLRNDYVSYILVLENQEAKYEIGNWKIFTYFKANALFCFFKILLCENCVYSSTIDFKTFEFNYTVKFPR